MFCPTRDNGRLARSPILGLVIPPRDVIPTGIFLLYELRLFAGELRRWIAPRRRACKCARPGVCRGLPTDDDGRIGGFVERSRGESIRPNAIDSSSEAEGNLLGLRRNVRRRTGRDRGRTPISPGIGNGIRRFPGLRGSICVMSGHRR